ncbi:MAG: HDOD domain-containing protein, partial [Nitrospinota bacterium]
MENLTDVKRSIEAQPDLPVISVVIAKILELCQSEKVNLSEISEVVKKDIALSAKILKIVNSPFYGFSRKIATISQAVVILGLEAVKNLSMGLSIVDAFSSKKDGFDYKSFWMASFYSATSARMIAKYTGCKNPEEVFVAGLIHDLGEVLLGSYYPESYKSVVRNGGEESGNVKNEERVFNVNHTEAGEILGSKWNLPERLTNVIRFHHSIDLWGIFPEEQKLLLKIIYLSDLFTAVFLEKGAVGRNVVNLNMEAKRVLKLTESQVKEIFEKSGEELEETVKYFSLDLSSARKPYVEIISEANKELSQINLSYEQVMLNIYKRNVQVNQEEKLAQQRQLEIVTNESGESGVFKGMVGQSVEMLKLFATIKQVAKYSTTILINGDTGTGKELVASAIHDLSPRKREKFVAFNIASIAPNLIESELFGHEKGAFTGADSRKTGLFEAANRGTVFIDEIGELPVPMQVSLLRV